MKNVSPIVIKINSCECLVLESGTLIRARGDTLSSQGDNVLPSDSKNQVLCNFDRNLPVYLLIIIVYCIY